MLCFYNSARILIARIYNYPTKYHKEKAKCYTWKSISRELRIFSLVECKNKLTGEKLRHEGIL